MTIRSLNPTRLILPWHRIKHEAHVLPPHKLFSGAEDVSDPQRSNLAKYQKTTCLEAKNRKTRAPAGDTHSFSRNQPEMIPSPSAQTADRPFTTCPGPKCPPGTWDSQNYRLRPYPQTQFRKIYHRGIAI